MKKTTLPYDRDGGPRFHSVNTAHAVSLTPVTQVLRGCLLSFRPPSSQRHSIALSVQTGFQPVTCLSVSGPCVYLFCSSLFLYKIFISDPKPIALILLQESIFVNYDFKKFYCRDFMIILRKEIYSFVLHF